MESNSGSSNEVPPADSTCGPAAVRVASVGQLMDCWLDNHLTAVVLAILGLGLVLRVLLAARTFLGPGEALNLLSSARPLISVAESTSSGTPQPLYWVFLHLWQALGRTDLVLRLPSVLAGTAAGWFGFLWLRSAFGRSAGLFGAILLTFAPALVRQSAVADGTAMLVLFETAALFFFDKARVRPSARDMLWCWVMLVLASASQPSGVWFVMAFGLYVSLGTVRRLPRRTAWTLLSAVVTALFAGAALYLPAALRSAPVAFGTAGAGLLNIGRDGVWSFLTSQTAAVFNYIFNSAEYGIVLLLIFLATATLLLARRIRPAAPDLIPGELAVLLLAPFVISYAAAVAGIAPYGTGQGVLGLAVFAIAGVSLFLARVAGRPHWLAMAAGLLVALGWSTGPAGVSSVLEARDRGLLDEALAYVREVVPPGGLVFSDRPTRIILERYLSNGRVALRAEEPMEIAAGGYGLVGPGRPGALSAESLEADLARLNDAIRPERGSITCVAAVGRSRTLADDLERATSVSYPGRYAFGPEITVFFVRMPGEALSELTHAAADSRPRPRTVFWPSDRLADPALESAGGLADQIVPYRQLYQPGAPGGRSAIYGFLPALAVWVFGNAERHPPFMRYMDCQEDFCYANLEFKLLAVDEDGLTGLFLVDAPVRGVLDSLAMAYWRSQQPPVRTILWPTGFPADSVLGRPVQRPLPVTAYADLYSQLNKGASLDQFLPAYAFWSFGSLAKHPMFLGYMDDGESYISAGYQFTLLTADPETLAGVYLVESRIGMVLDSLARIAVDLPVAHCRTVLWPGPQFTDSTTHRTGQLADEVLPYSELYLRTRGRSSIDDFLPALAFWVYNNPEEHPPFMDSMNYGKSYVSGQYRFTRLIEDRRDGAAVYLIEK